MSFHFDAKAGKFGFCISSITFSDGSSVTLEKGTTLVITGPNSSGKSATLREIQRHLTSPRLPGPPHNPNLPFFTVRDVLFDCARSMNACLDWFRLTYEIINAAPFESFLLPTAGRGQPGPISVTPRQSTEVNALTDQLVSTIHQAFLQLLDTQSRLSVASLAQSIQYTSHPSAYIHFLQRDSMLADKISDLVYSAFKKRLMINFGGGPQVWFHVGQRPDMSPGEDRVSPSYLRKLASQPRLDDEGDGVRSFVGTALAAIVGKQPVLLVDEPEAFLHPPQARKLGSVLASTAANENRQIIIATHSSDIIQGAMNSSSNVIVCRITRTGEANHVSVLGKTDLQDLWSKPLLRSSAAINGLFHTGAIICEADADCRFYETIALQNENTVGSLDLYFVHGGGKGALPGLCRAYKSLDIPIAAIADLDLLRQNEAFKAVATALGAEYGTLEPLVIRVSAALRDRNPVRSVSEFSQDVERVLARVKGSRSLGPEDRRELLGLLDEASAWSEAKRYGIERLNGPELTAGRDLLARCKEFGLFLVPKGELERWWREGPSSKTEWILAAIPKLAEDPNVFSEARAFVSEVCSFLSNGGIGAEVRAIAIHRGPIS